MFNFEMSGKKADRRSIEYLCTFALFLGIFSSAKCQTIKNEHVEDIFTSGMQGKWLSDMGKTIADDLSKYKKGKAASFDHKRVVDNLINSVKESASSGQPLDDAIIQGLEELKVDPHFNRILKQFDESLEGKRNILTVGMIPPKLAREENDRPTKDVGLNGLVLTGEDSDTENDLIRYSNYISGAGSTFGGTVAGLPENLKDLTTGALGTLRFKYESLRYQLAKYDHDLSKLRLQNQKRLAQYGITPTEYVRWQRTHMKDLRTDVLEKSYQKVSMMQGLNDEKRLLNLHQNTQNKLLSLSQRKFSTKIARRTLNRIGNGIAVLGTAFSLAQGGVDAAAGDDIIAKAHEAKRNGTITDSEYEDMIRDGQLRVAQGSFGIANGMKNVGEFTGKRLTAKISARLSAAGTKLLAQASRFGSFVGSAIAVGTGITSVAKNAIAAYDAGKSGNTGKAVMYGFMAAIDVVTVVLDGASFAADFFFPPLSIILDVASTVLQVVNTVLGFFADLFDFRSNEQIIKDDFDTYVNSDEFKQYIDDLASEYKTRGFDLFNYYVDAEVTNADKESVNSANKEQLRGISKNISRALTDRANRDITNPTLRLAIVDATNTGRILRGRLNSDEILAGFGPDKIYGEGGDDYLFGRGGDDSIYGGPGNDILSGGTGRDQLFGDKGNDYIYCEPGIDINCRGGEGDDTLVLNSTFLLHNLYKHLKFDSSSTLPITGVYIDLHSRRNGINLGSCFRGWPTGFHRELHKPAFRQIGSGSQNPPRYVIPRDFSEFLSKLSFSAIDGSEDLSQTVFWYLANVKNDGDVLLEPTKYGRYFTDGQSIYHAVGNDMRSIQRGIIQNLPAHTPTRIKTLLHYAFNKGFGHDRFERIASIKPRDEYNLKTYIPTIVIGNNDNSIDLSHGINDIAITGNGNNIVSIGSILNDCLQGPTRRTTREPGNPYNCSTWYKYVDGNGEGQNTLVIQSRAIPGRHPKKNHGYWELRDHDKIPTNYNAHVVLMRNIQTVVVHARIADDLPDSIVVDARNYKGAGRYIIDPEIGGEELVFYGPRGRDVTLLPKKLYFSHTNKNHYLLSEGHVHTLSLKFYEDEENRIKSVILKPGHESFVETWSNHQIKITQVANVVGTSSIQTIWGNSEPNMLYAVGGECFLVGDDGDDTLVSGRGIHELKGSSGTDTYVLHGPEIAEYLTISIHRKREDGAIRCSTERYGNLDGRNLIIDILSNDPKEIQLTQAKIVPDFENSSIPQGKIQIRSRKLYFMPGSDFDRLGKNEAKTIRVMYKTKGSHAKILEETEGNQLRLEGVSSFDELSAYITADGLLFKKNDRKVFLDMKWAKRIEYDDYTSLDDLINDFTARFPLILFKNNDSSFTRAEPRDIIKFLYTQLESIVGKLGQNFDSFIDSTKLPANVGDEINVGNGANVVLAKTKGKTYVLGEKSSKSIIFANKFSQSSGEVTVRGGGDKNSLNAIVISPTSDTVVNVKLQGPHDIIIEGTPNDITSSKSGSEVSLKSRRGKGAAFAKFDLEGTIRFIIFKNSNPKFDHVVMDVKIFARELQEAYGPPKFNTKPAWIGATYTPNGLMKLNMPDFSSQQAVLILEKREIAVWVYFAFGLNRNHVKFRYPYLLIPGTIEDTLKAEVVIKAAKYQFKDGIQFSDKEIKSEKICVFLKEKLKKKEVRFKGFEFTPKINGNFTC